MDKPQPEDQADRIKTALFEGRKIEAIKLYREQTGVGLKEAKDAVEKLEADLQRPWRTSRTLMVIGRG